MHAIAAHKSFFGPSEGNFVTRRFNSFDVDGSCPSAKFESKAQSSIFADFCMNIYCCWLDFFFHLVEEKNTRCDCHKSRRDSDDCFHSSSLCGFCFVGTDIFARGGDPINCAGVRLPKTS